MVYFSLFRYSGTGGRKQVQTHSGSDKATQTDPCPSQQYIPSDVLSDLNEIATTDKKTGVHNLHSSWQLDINPFNPAGAEPHTNPFSPEGTEPPNKPFTSVNIKKEKLEVEGMFGQSNEALDRCKRNSSPHNGSEMEDFGAFNVESTGKKTIFSCPRCMRSFQDKRYLLRHVKKTSCLAVRGDTCCICRKTDCVVPYENSDLVWQHLTFEIRKGSWTNNIDGSAGEINKEELIDGEQHREVPQAGSRDSLLTAEFTGKYKLVKCPLCFKEFKGMKNFHRHVTRSSCVSKKSEVCCICKKIDCAVPFDNKRLRWKHFMAENPNMIADSPETQTDVSCPRCLKVFAKRKVLYRHVTTSLCFNEKGEICCVCHKSDCLVPYEDKSLLWQHIKNPSAGLEEIESEAKKQRSKICGKRTGESKEKHSASSQTKSEIDLSSQTQDKKGDQWKAFLEKPYICAICRKEIPSKKNVYYHMRYGPCVTEYQGDTCPFCLDQDCKVKYTIYN